MYMYMYMHTHACMHAHIYIYIDLHTYIYTHIQTHTYVYVYIYIWMLVGSMGPPRPRWTHKFETLKAHGGFRAPAGCLVADLPLLVFGC